MAMDSTIPTKIKTLDCIFGFSLIAARPAAPTKPRPIPAPSPASPKANPAARNLKELSLAAASSCAYAAGFVNTKPANAREPRTLKREIAGFLFSASFIRASTLKALFNYNCTAIIIYNDWQ